MFKFLTIGITILLLYLGFSYAQEYDLMMKISVSYFQIELSLFTLMVIFLFAHFILMIVIKIFSTILNLPRFFKEFWKKRKLKGVNDKLMHSICNFIVGNKKIAYKISSKIYNKLDNEGQDISDIIIAESEEDIEKKLSHYKKILQNNNLNPYANKQIALIYQKEGQYLNAEKFALKYFEQNETDQENLANLLKIYAALKEWKKFSLLSNQFKRNNYNQPSGDAKIITNFFCQAAKECLTQDNDPQAKAYLEQGLELTPDHIESLNLYTNLAINLKNSAEIIQILKAAFKFNSCFEIGVIYANCASNSNEAIFGTLASLSDTKKNKATFLALAAYLNLTDKIEEIIKNPKKD